MSKYTIGIDYGSLSGRAVVIDVENGKQLGECVMDYPHAVMSDVLASSGEKLPADYALQDPDDYLKVLFTVVPGAVKDAGVRSEDIIGIGIDFTCCTLLPVDENGEPLCFKEKYKNDPHAYVKLWKHHAAEKYAIRISSIAQERGEKWLERFGGKISSEWMFPKIWQVLDEDEEIYNAAAYFIEAGDWINWVLTGKQTRGYAFAACKSMYIPDEGGYPSEEFFASLDERLRHVVKDKLDAPIIHTGETAGYVCEYASEMCGIPKGIPVACVQPDAHTATISLGLKNDGDMCGIMGTSSCYMLIGKEEKKVPGICGTVKESMLPGFYGYEAGLCCVGDHFAWVRDNMVRDDYRKEAEEKGVSYMKLLIDKASKQAPGENGLIALNWFNGNRNILIDATRSGMILGMTLRTRPEDIMRALIEATAYGTRVIIENYKEHGVKVGRFIAAGGIARKDPFTMQVYADILKMDIEVSDTAQAPALSGAIQAAAAAGSANGGYDTLLDAMENMCGKCEKIYHPNKQASDVYDRLYAEYKTLHDYFGRGENDVMRRLRTINDR